VIEAPASFRASLERQFDGRLRVRWSEAKGEWHIEQKMARSRLARRRVAAGTVEHDEVVRAADGYVFVLAVRPGNRVPCPKCGKVLGIPELRMKRSTCPLCSHSFLAVYYPLGDMLLEHLRYTDPYRDGLDRIFKAQEDAEQQVKAAQHRERHNEGEALWKDHFTQIAGIQSVGYTGREDPAVEYKTTNATERSV
jgi:hypothetical protein